MQISLRPHSITPATTWSTSHDVCDYKTEVVLNSIFEAVFFTKHQFYEEQID